MAPVLQLATTVPEDVALIATPVFSGGTVPESAVVEVDLEALAVLGFEGKLGETAILASSEGPALLAVGMGEADGVDAERLRRAAAAAVRGAWRATSLTLTLLDARPEGLPGPAAAQAIAEGALLAAYRFTKYKSDPAPCRLERIDLIGRGARVAAAVERAAVIAGAVAMARDLVNEPAGAMTPVRLAEVATELADAQASLACEVLDEADIEAQGLGGLAGVASGSSQPARLIRLVYEPSRPRSTLALVGKGITFDSGGLSLKTAQGMMTMKADMTGAAVVLAVMSVLPLIKPPVRVIGLVAATENLPGGRAYKPGDVLRIRNGKTVEVLNTDAEGRLVLADALSLAVEAEPDAIIDLATLTGACVVALGKRIAGLMGNNEPLIAAVRAAADRAGEPAWPLPLPEDYRREIDSPVADVKNIGDAGGAGALTAGLFLAQFVGEVPWAHLDIAGPAWTDRDEGYLAQGATASGVRTVLELLGSGALPRPSSRRVKRSG
jgi:leucyl aminopeptidase